MASCKYYSFLNFLFFCMLLQKNILVSAGDNCVNPTFNKDQKVTVEYFFDADAQSIEDDICGIIKKSNGLVNIVFRMCSSMKDKCFKLMPRMNTDIADCVCDGSADDILTSNETARTSYGIQALPALVVNQKYDPCFKDYTWDSMLTYFCKAYKNGLPLCKSSS